MSRPRATSAGCVINQPVRRETDADATETNQFDVTWIFCGKLSRCPVRGATERAAIEETRTNTELSALSTVKLHGSMAALRSAPRSFRLGRHAEIPCVTRRTESLQSASPRGAARLRPKPVPKMKDPSGGTTGRVKPYGRLGWMGARAEYSRWGGITAPTYIKSQHARRTFKTPCDFFNLVFADDCRKITAQQAISRRLRPICPTPSMAGSRSVPGSRKRYRQTGQAPAFFLPRACRKPRQAEPPARRSPR